MGGRKDHADDGAEGQNAMRERLRLPETAFGDDVARLLSRRLTPMRLAAFGASAFAAMARRQARDLPDGSNLRALRALCDAALHVALWLRLWDDVAAIDPDVASQAARETARGCARWQSLAGRVHADFRPVFELPPDRAEPGRDCYGFPVNTPVEGWPIPAARVACRPHRSDAGATNPTSEGDDA